MSKNQSPLVSIVILSWNTLAETMECLESIRESDYKNMEIVVVDNGSSDGSKDYLSDLKYIKYVDLPENTGFTGGQLAALEVANGDYLALINSDAVIAHNWVSVLVEYLEASPGVGAVGGKAFTWKDGEKPYVTTGSFYSYQEVDIYKGYPTTLTTGDESCFVDSISGAGVMVRKLAIDKTGYFDDRFFAYYEETDLFARMIRAGYKIAFVPEAHVWHKIAQSTKDKPYFYLYHMHRNRFMFAVKNFDGMYALLFFLFYVADGLRAGYSYSRRGQLDDKARWHSLWWNLKNLGKTLRSRRAVKSLGKMYTQHLAHFPRPADVTIIIPCYNYAQYLSEAIESVLGQTLAPKRVIVIDDGSTDDSVKIAKRYEDRGVEVISKQNEGVIPTKNLGILMATTTWTIFLDADDVIPKNYIKILVRHAQKEDCDVVYTDMEYFGAKDGVLRAGRFNRNRLLNGNYIHNSALIATHLLKQIQGYKEVMRGGYEDWELYLTIAETNARFDYSTKTKLFYRQHPTESRNADAEARAIELHKLVESLHPRLYNNYHPTLYKLKWGVVGLAKNPLLPFLLIIKLPRIFGASLKAFILTFQHRVRLTAHTYFAERNERRIEEDQLHDD